MLAILTVVVLAGSFACMFGLMWGLQRLGGVGTTAVAAPRPAPLPPPARRIAGPLGPDDDPAFLGELRRRIDRGHFGG